MTVLAGDPIRCSRALRTQPYESRGVDSGLGSPRVTGSVCFAITEGVAMKPMVPVASALVLGLFFAPTATRQQDESADGFLLRMAAAHRTVQPGDLRNILFIVVNDLNVALGSSPDSAGREQGARKFGCETTGSSLVLRSRPTSARLCAREPLFMDGRG